MTPSKFLIMLIIAILGGYAAFRLERRGDHSAAPVATGNTIDARTAVQRLEALAIRNEMSMWVYSREVMGRGCSVSAETGPTDDTHGVRRSASTCEAAATEVLKVLEARNVR
jgi:hypothetical protein